jgi:transposase
MARPKKYPDEVVAHGVRLALESGRPIAHIAADLGMHPDVAKTCAQADSGARPDLPTTAKRKSPAESVRWRVPVTRCRGFSRSAFLSAVCGPRHRVLLRLRAVF